MPALSKEQSEDIKSRLSKKHVSETCNVCNYGKLRLDVDLIYLPNTSGSLVPFLILICENCFHANFFIADPLIMGEDMFDLTPPPGFK